MPEGDWYCSEGCQQVAAATVARATEGHEPGSACHPRTSGADSSGSSSSKVPPHAQAAEAMDADGEEAGDGRGRGGVAVSLPAGNGDDGGGEEDKDEGSVSRLVSAATAVWEGRPAAAAPWNSQLGLLCTAGQSLAPPGRDIADDEQEVLEVDAQAPDPFDEDSEEEDEMPLQRRRPVPREA